jgi:hypothetical protein
MYKHSSSIKDIQDNYISNKIKFVKLHDYTKTIAVEYIQKDEIIIIEYPKINLFGEKQNNRELKILKKYIENKDNYDIINLYPRDYNFIRTYLIKSVHNLIKSIKCIDQKLYNFLIDYKKEDLEFYFAKYIFNSFEGHEFGPLTLPNIAKLNHSCNPNVKFKFNKNNRFMYVKSIRNIKKGEEIFDSYLENKKITEHKSYLRNHYGFICQC